MFVQVIEGQVSDPGQLRMLLDRWVQELAPGATGWLGSTAGVTGDGRFVALARFESGEAARNNSDRPEQDDWWSDAAKLCTGEVTFCDSHDVVVDVIGEPDDAGFVQIIQGRGSDPARARELMGQNAAEWAAFRPDVIGSVAVFHDDGAYTMALYFSSEAAAREGERKEPPALLRAQMEQMDALNIGEPAFFDLTQPWLFSP